MYDNAKRDAFIIYVGRFGRKISFGLALICLLALFVGVVEYMGSGPEKLQEPSFDAFQPYLFDAAGQQKQDLDFSIIDARRAVENKYDSHIKKVVTDYSFDQGMYITLVNWMTRVPENRRTRFITGLYDFLDDFKGWLEKKENEALAKSAGPTLYKNMADMYNSIFLERLKKEEVAWTASFQERENILIFIGFSLIFLILFLSVPILIKIEENTRFFK